MPTPMQRQRARQMDERRAALMTRTDGSAISTESQHIKLLALDNDIRQLHNMELLSDKLEFKRNTLLPRWLPHAQAYLEGERVYQNP
ncbi:terminase, partial [Escherichia coli]|nr:terminase [Escherichia coli]